MLVAGAKDGTRAVVNRLYCALDAHDPTRLEAVLHPHVLWQAPARPDWDGHLVGRDAVLAWLGRFAPGGEHDMRRQALLPVGPDVIEVHGRHRHRGPDGATCAIAFVHRVRVGGGQVTRFVETLPDGVLRAHVALRTVHG